MTHVYTEGGGKQIVVEELVRKLTFGVMASRAVDDVDRALAEILYSLANYLDRWVLAKEEEPSLLQESGKKAS